MDAASVRRHAFGTVSTPYVEVYTWNDTTGFGTKFSNPITLPPLNVSGVMFNPTENALAVSHASSPFLTVYPWSNASGFGVKYSNPGTLPTGNGQYVAFSH